ncbi:MAG TPA: hypothetical protein VL899_15375 [Alphaproteobacteria bacterium]|jgi:hypothetical protein|nr:hypothetical protein [Alphaproteobacteria bacterium]
MPPILTLVAPVNAVTVTLAPIGPWVGVKDVTVGAAAKAGAAAMHMSAASLGRKSDRISPPALRNRSMGQINWLAG